KQVWPDTFVEESNLSRNIYLLRKALGEESEEVRYIETVPRRGYRFVAAVREMPDEGDTVLIRQRTRARVFIEEEIPEGGARPIPSAPAAADGPAGATRPALAPASRRRTVGYLVASAAVLCVALLSYLWFSGRGAKNDVAGGVTAPESIAVLPFRPLGAEGNDDLLGLGMADATIIKLSSLQKLRVMPTSTVYDYTGRAANDPLAAGRELGVETVLGGTVQRAGERVRVTLQLLSVTDGRTLWTGKFDERFTDIFTLQDSISEQVAVALALKLSGGEWERLSKHQTRNTEAYQAYLMGIYHWNKRTKESLHKAVEYFQRAIDGDATYALAYGTMADAYALLALNHESDPDRRKEFWERAKAAASKAIELDPSTAEAYTALAMVKSSYERDWMGAAEAHRHALSLNPSYATGHVRYAWFLINNGRLEEGVSEMRRAQELDPLSPITNAALCNVLYYSRQYDDSIRYCRRAIEVEPENNIAHFNLGESYALKGMYQEAIASFQKARELRFDSTTYRDSTNTLEATGVAYAMAGRETEARRVLAELDKLARSKEISDANVAIIYSALGEQDRAFQRLEKSSADKLPRAFLRYDPMLDSLRSDPRFAEYLHRSDLSHLLNRPSP
ncbi:MAG TPA: tetratricopeptide repeat protein, partial [Pyrinomonadaceae bacterium]|nr:tetratricopeptide repeat protein [Pyrinomonadaceae bacterium]